MKFSNKDRKEHLFHYNENNEFTHDGVMTIRAYMGLPALCTIKALPTYEPETEKCYFINDEWVKTELFIGRNYYDENAKEMFIKSFPESMPEHYSLTKPPKPKKGFAVRLVNNKWKQLEDHREKIAFAKDRDNDEKGDYQVEELGVIPDTHTLLEPKQFDSWNVELDDWQYDEARYRPYWAQTEKQWQQELLTKVKDELLFYAQDKQIPEIYSELRKTNYTEDEYYSLLGDRILLNEYVEQDDFPECGRPTLSGLVK